jgi:hypothetical protein
VSALDNYSDWGTIGGRQLASSTPVVVNLTFGCFDWSVVVVFFGFGTQDVTADGSGCCQSRKVRIVCCYFGFLDQVEIVIGNCRRRLELG